MQDATKLLNEAWLKKMDVEAKAWKKLDKSKQKQWSENYLATCVKAFKIVSENGKETATKVNAIKDAVKMAIDGTEKIIEGKRKKNEPLSDAERAWIAKAKTTIDGSANAVDAATKVFSDYSPMCARGSFWDVALKEGAVGKDFASKIEAVRAPSISVGNDFGKSGPPIVRLQEYRKRWDVLTAELQGLEKQRTGQLQDWAAAINKQLAAFSAGNEKWANDLQGNISKITSNLKTVLEKIDDNPKKFGASLVNAIKLKVSKRAKNQATDDMKVVQVRIKLCADFLKQAKGSLKTRLTEYQSLNASLKDAGPYADPQRKKLAELGKQLADYQKDVDALAVQVNEAVKAAAA